MSREPGTERPIRHLTSRAARRTLAGTWRRVPFPLRAPTRPMSVAPAPDTRSGVGFETGWARTPVARAVRLALTETVWRGAAAIYASPTVEGRDRLDGLDREGGAIFAANHHSHADTTLLLTVVPYPWRRRLFVAAAADYFFPTPTASVLSALGMGAVPIERTKISKRSLELPIELLRDGWCQIIYPEGGRSPDGWTQDFRPGVALLARMAGVPVVPVHIDGTGEVLPRGATWPRRAPTRVVFGRPMRPGEREDHRDFAARLQAAVAELADESTTDWWSARRRAHEGTTPPTSGPDAPSWRRTWALGADRAEQARRRWPRP